MSKKKKKVKGSPKKKVAPKKNKLGKTQVLIGLGAIFLLTFLVLSRLQNSSFLNYDDDIYITNNPYIANLTGGGISALFSSFFSNQYAPVAMLIMALEVKLVGMQAGGLKLLSILFHLLNGFLVYTFINKLFKRQDMALLIAALFCIHPIQLESVAWLSASMKIEAFSFFFLASMIAYLNFLEKKNIQFYIAAFGLFVLSCFSKEQAVSLSVTLLAIDYFKNRNLLSRTVILEKIPFLVVSVIFGIITISASQGIDQNQNTLQFGIFDKLTFASYSLIAYIFKLILPTNLSFLYFFPIKGNVPIFFYLSFLLSIPILFGLYYAWKKDNKFIVFGLLFFLINIGLAVASQVFAVRDVIMADRYAYLPSIGIFILMAYGLDRLMTRKPKLKQSMYGAIGVYIILLAFLTYQRTAIWKDSYTVFTDAIENVSSYNQNTPYLSLAYLNRGLAKKSNNDIQGALADYNKAITLNPADHKAFLNRGNINFNASKWDEAIADYDRSISLNDQNAKSFSSRGAAYGSKGNYQQAIQDITKALELDPNFTDARKNRMLIYYFQGNYQASLEDCTLFLQQSPNDAGMWNQRGLIYQALGKWNEAEADFNKSIQMQPNEGSYYFNRSLFYKQIGKFNEARRDAQSAQNLGHQVPADYLNSLQ